MNAPLHEITIPLSSARVAKRIMSHAKRQFLYSLNWASDEYKMGFKDASAKYVNQAGEWRRIYAQAKAAYQLLDGVA